MLKCLSLIKFSDFFNLIPELASVFWSLFILILLRSEIQIIKTQAFHMRDFWNHAQMKQQLPTVTLNTWKLSLLICKLFNGKHVGMCNIISQELFQIFFGHVRGIDFTQVELSKQKNQIVLYGIKVGLFWNNLKCIAAILYYIPEQLLSINQPVDL